VFQLFTILIHERSSYINRLARFMHILSIILCTGGTEMFNYDYVCSNQSKPLNIEATIQGYNTYFESRTKDEKPTDSTMARVNELGLESLIISEKLLEVEDPAGISIEKLGDKCLELSTGLKSSKIGRLQSIIFGSKPEKVRDALNYLEVFCLYAAQSNYLEHSYVLTHSLEEKGDKNVRKAVQSIEATVDLIKGKKVICKDSLKSQIKVVESDVRRVLMHDISKVHQRTFAKPVNEAILVLKRYS